MMKKLAIVLTAKLCLACRMAFGIAASQAWVTNYVANSVAELQRRIDARTSGGVYSSTLAVDGVGVVSNVVEEATVGALVVRDATPLAEGLGVTNGMLFAWNGDAAYVNGALRIEATKTNLTFGAYRTAYVDAQTWLVGDGSARLCRIASTLMQPSAAEAIGGAR